MANPVHTTSNGPTKMLGETASTGSSTGNSVQRKTVPNVFITYFLEGISHPPYMYVSKLAACCAMLFVERSDDDLLKVLCDKWAIRFGEERKRLKRHYTRKMKSCKDEQNTDKQDLPDLFNIPRLIIPSSAASFSIPSAAHTTTASSPIQAARASENVDSTFDSPTTPGTSETEVTPFRTPFESPVSPNSRFPFLALVAEGKKEVPSVPSLSYFLHSSFLDDHEVDGKGLLIQCFLRLLKSAAFLYFSYNWGKTDFLIQINREYAYYIRDTVLPMCVALEPNEGVDEYPLKPSLLSPFRVLYRFANPRSASYEFIVPGSTSLRNTVDISRTISSTGSLTPPIRSPSGTSPTSVHGFPLTERPSSCVSPCPPAQYGSGLVVSASQPVFPRSLPCAFDSKGKAVETPPSYLLCPSCCSKSFATSSHTDGGSSLSSIPSRAATETPDAFSTTLSGASAGIIGSSKKPLNVPYNSRKNSHSQTSSGGGTGVSGVLLPSHSVEASGHRSPTNVRSRRFFQRLEEKSASRIFHLTSDTYPEFMKENTTGILIVFHGMYCAKSNALRKVLDVFMERNPVDPMPKVAVVNTVSEPRLAALYNIWWLPSIIYTPPYSRGDPSASGRGMDVLPPQASTPKEETEKKGFDACERLPSSAGERPYVSPTESVVSSVSSRDGVRTLTNSEGNDSTICKMSASTEKKGLATSFVTSQHHGKESSKGFSRSSFSSSEALSSAAVTPAPPNASRTVSPARSSRPPPDLLTAFPHLFLKSKESSWGSTSRGYAEDMNFSFGFHRSSEFVGQGLPGTFIHSLERMHTEEGVRPPLSPSHSEPIDKAAKINDKLDGTDADHGSGADAIASKRKEQDCDTLGFPELLTGDAARSVNSIILTGVPFTQHASLPPVEHTFDNVEAMEALCGVYRVFPFNRAPSVHVLAEWIRSEGTYVATEMPHRLEKAAKGASQGRISHFAPSDLSSGTLFHDTLATDVDRPPTAVETQRMTDENTTSHPETEDDGRRGMYTAHAYAETPLQSSMLLTSDQLKACLHAAVTFLRRIDRPVDYSILREVPTIPSCSFFSSKSQLTASLFPCISTFPTAPQLSSSTGGAPCSPLISPPLLPSSSAFTIHEEPDAASTGIRSGADPMSGTAPPFFVFLGGGMAAGKTTALRAFYESAWWKERAGAAEADVVVVAADEFKTRNFDPNNQAAHLNSTKSAELLLIQALNQCRNIILDGTMMWAPFVVDVIKVIRAAHTTIFKPAKGYHPDTGEERYFEFARARSVPYLHPYKILCLGITVEPYLAVPLGLLRHFSTGRGVRIRDQLRSFKLFSHNFPLYVTLVDAIYLLDNNAPGDIGKDEPPRIIALKEECDACLRIVDEEAYALFQRQRNINIAADNVKALFKEELNP